MNIKLHEILIKDLVENYVNSDEEGVIGYNGRLNIRPPYQYKKKEVNKSLPFFIQTQLFLLFPYLIISK